MTAAEIDPLDQLLGTLTQLTAPDDLSAAESLRARLRVRRLRVLVVGEAKRGKSTLVNRLLGQDVLPTGVVPVTAIATTVRRVRENGPTWGSVLVSYTDGRRERRELNGLPELVTEGLNPRNEKGIASVAVLLGPGQLDQFDLELVDTPGTGSVFERNTATAREAYESLDAAIVVVTADPPISASERDLLQEITARSVHTIVFVNKADQLVAGDLAEAVEFTRGVCEQAADRPLPVFAGSARAGRTSPGYAEFEDAFAEYLASNAHRDMDRALSGHLRRLVVSLLDADRLAQRSLELIAAGSRERVESFAARLRDVRAQQNEVADRGWATERGLRRSLDQSAAQLRPQLTSQCLTELTQALDGPLSAVPAEELDDRGRAVLAQVIETAVNQWRGQEASSLDTGLQALWHRITEEHEQQLSGLRDAARRLLDLDLAAPSQVPRLADSRGFWYMFDRPPSVELPFAGTARRIAPGRSRRTRARLLEEVPGLVDRQIGRARADLQERLSEGMRRLLADLHRVHEDVTDRLERSLAAVSAARKEGAVAARTRTVELSERVNQLNAILRQLDDIDVNE